MNFALFLLLPASAATDLTPPAHAAAQAAAVTTYDAILATEDTSAANDLAKPAVFVEEKAGKSVVSASGTRWIA